ncbi:MAG: DNA internalization-related competence protein ComEC/Rec2 [Panacagrimonas sp.]
MDAGVRAPAPDIRGLSLALTVGVLAIYFCARLPPPWMLFALSVPALLPWRGRALWSAATLGALLAFWQAQTRLDERWPASRHAGEVEARGAIVSLPERSSNPQRDGEQTLRFEFAPEDRTLPSRIRVSWYRTDQVLRGGECWTLRLRMRTPRGSLDPGAFDYEGWLFRRGVGATATVKQAEPCGVASGYRVLRARQALVDRIGEWLGDHRGRSMVTALTVGDDSGFSDADWDAFRETGTSHLVAISGFNVAIVAAVFYFLARWAWSLSLRLTLSLPAQKAGLIAAAVAGIAYGLLAGWESPAQRAALMLALLLMAALPDRTSQPSRLLALTWLLMLIVDPAAVLSPGLWLSFGAVAAIFFISTARVRPTSRWWLALELQIMLSIVLAPLTLWFFHGASWPGPLVNLLAVPAMTVLTPLVLMAVLLALAIPALGVPALHFAADALALFQSGLSWIAAWTPGAWVPAAPSASAIALALFGSVLLFAPRGWPMRPLALLCLLPLFVPQRAPVPGALELTVLDVGQGLAVVARTANHTLLYDAGPAFEDGFDAGESVVAPYLLRIGSRRVDRLLLSHGDSDHAGGVPSVRKLVRVLDEVGTPGHRLCVDGQAWEWDGVRFEVLHPDGDEWSDNDRSCVLRIEAGGLTALLTGDIERHAEARLLAAHADRLRADVLIAPHHGSRTSSTEDFVRAVSPELVVFGAAWRSHFRHPRPEVVARYEAGGARSLVTGVEGAVRIWRDADGHLRSESWRRQAARFWNASAEP